MESTELPEGWRLLKLSDVGKIVSGGTPSTAIHEYWNGNISWISPADLTGYTKKYISSGAKSITAIGLEKSSARLMPKGAVLFSSRAPIGYVAIAANELATNQGFKSIIPNDDIDSNYLYHFLKGAKQLAESVASGTTFKEISLSSFSQLKIPIPPRPVQELIVSKIEELLSELDKGVEQLKIAQKQLRIYRQAVLKWAFEGKFTNRGVKEDCLPIGWKWTKIGDLCKSIVPNRDKPKSFTGDTKWITTPDIDDELIRIDYENAKLGLSEKEIKIYAAKVIPVGSVIMTCVGTFGVSAIVEQPIVINQQLHAFLPNELVHPKFLAFCIQNNKHYLESKSTSTTIQYLNKENCNGMPFPLCSIAEQTAVVWEIESRINKANELSEVVLKSIKRVEALRQSVLKTAFEGNLVLS